jgi:PAT family beta-lactamase induction signal transducer AmpG
MIKYLKKKSNILSVFFFGFSSGLPFYLLVSTLIAWLIQSGISKTNVGLFFWVTITYSLKFFWSPIIENIKIPILHLFFGRRRSWLLLSQIILIIFLFLLSECDPNKNFYPVLLISFFIGFFFIYTRYSDRSL